ncbi:MAG: hypothetical protein QXI02_02110 [Candidatus Caldarchaeum sp.]
MDERTPLEISVAEIEAAERLPDVVPSGTYTATISVAVARYSQRGNPIVELTLRPVLEDGSPARPIFHRMVLPTKDMSTEARQYRLVELKEFCASAGIDPSVLVELVTAAFAELAGLDDQDGVSIDDLVGLTVSVSLGVEPEREVIDQDGRLRVFSARNRVRRFLS